MTSRDLGTTLDWVETGTRLFHEQLGYLRDDEAMEQPSALPDWTRKHLVAHVAANADALGNLVAWARTGEPHPMYASMQQRDADIADGGSRLAADLVEWSTVAAGRLREAMAALRAEHWEAEVVTAQGRSVPATEIPWLRAREVLVHTVDLDTGVAFADLPVGFLSALVDDIVGKRTAGEGVPLVLLPTDSEGSWQIGEADDPLRVTGTLADLTAYLAGRSHGATTTAGDPAPELPRWL